MLVHQNITIDVTVWKCYIDILPVSFPLSFVFFITYL